MSSEYPAASICGLWQPDLKLKHLFYGSGCVERHLLHALPSPKSRVFIITGNSLATKTPLVQQLEALLGKLHVGTISYIRQHGPIDDVERAIEEVLGHDADVDALISLGGGSPIDTAKVISLRASERRPGTGGFLTHVAIPTTLSAAECTAGGGYTKAEDGVKVGFRAPGMGPSAIFYDPLFARYTPRDLWLSSGMRAMDHAVESIYHPTATEVPWKVLALWAAGELFECLPKFSRDHSHNPPGPVNGDEEKLEHEREQIMLRLMLAAFASSGLKGENIVGGMGLSHSLGHALGSPYGIPHGITSCMTLAKVVRLKAQESPENAKQIARLIPATTGGSGGAGSSQTGDNLQDALEVADRIYAMIESLRLDVGTLATRGISRAEIPVIVQRALRGANEGPLYDQVAELVQTLF